MNFDQYIGVYGLYLSLAGIVITVVFSVWSGNKKSKKSNTRQRQDVGPGGAAIQAGRDVNMGGSTAERGEK